MGSGSASGSGTDRCAPLVRFELEPPLIEQVLLLFPQALLALAQKVGLCSDLPP